MLKLLCYILFPILTYASCNQEQANESPNRVEIITETGSEQFSPKENISHERFEDIFITTIDSTYPCQLARPDTSVYGVILQDRKSSIKQLGEKFEPIEGNDNMANMTFCSQDKSQIFRVYFHYGGYRNVYSEFQVKENSINESATILQTDEFVTNSGIKLGLTKGEIISILGKCFKTIKTNGNTEIIKYHIDDLPHSKFLQRYNYPSYYAEYEFRSDKLIRYRFGFE